MVKLLNCYLYTKKVMALCQRVQFVFGHPCLTHQYTLKKLQDGFKHYFTYSSNVYTNFTKNSSNNNHYLPRNLNNKTQNCIKIY